MQTTAGTKETMKGMFFYLHLHTLQKVFSFLSNLTIAILSKEELVINHFISKEAASRHTPSSFPSSS